MIQRVFCALSLLHDFQGVECVVCVPGKDRAENDVEHSYLLAMLAWQFAEIIAPELSRDKILRYALVHDLVEVYAGDTFFYHQAHSSVAQEKKEREHVALARILEERVLGDEICASLREYEAREDDEARFVYALDKVIPIMTIYLDGGRPWKKHGISLEELIALKYEKVSVSPQVLVLFHELVALLRKHEQELFPLVS